MREALELVAELVLRESGIRVQPAQHPALRSAIARALPNDDAAAFLVIAANPVDGPRAIATLIDEVTIKETFFYRDRQQLDAIPWRALLEHARAAGSPEIRIWCAACATGEEAYTLALLACEAFAPAAPPVRILATDISSAALAASSEGRYRERSLRTVAPSLRDQYFEEDGDQLVVGDRLRRIVTFAQHNLVTGSMPPLGETAFDLITCRNVLIYFDGETADRVIDGLRSALRPEGTLILGAADVLCGTARRLVKLETVPVRPQSALSSPTPLRKPLGVAPAAEGSGSLDPFAVEPRFLKAIAELESGEALAAAESLRHVLYLDPTFGLAAFALGRAHEATGDPGAARRAYQQALRTIDMTDDRHDHLLEQVDLVDVATACRARIATL
jgi:chemotaxis methyl-accepting protein methylase